MKILLLIDSLAPGGAERQMSYLAVGLKNAGNDVKLVVFSKNVDFYKPFITNNNVKMVCNVKGQNRFRRIFEIVKLVKNEKPDAVISYKDGVSMAACLARSISHFKLIVSERNTTQALTIYEKFKFYLYRIADYIVPNSYSQAEFIGRNFPKLRNKVEIITNTIDGDKFSRIKYNKHRNDSFTIVTTARVMDQKNVLTYLDAISILKDEGFNISFKWYGSQVKAYYPSVMAKRKELGIEDMIDFYPPVTNVEDVYARADAFCLPSKYEGFPNVVCEAMASGLPIICSNVCDNPYIVQSGINGFLFNPTNPKEMAESIKRIYRMGKSERIEMGLRNSDRIRQLCSIDKFITSYSNLI